MSFFRELVAQRKTFLQNFCLILFCCCCLLDWLLWVWNFAFIWVEGFFEGVYLSNRKVTKTEDKSRGSKSRKEAERDSQGGNHHWQSSGKPPSVLHTSERGDSRMPGTWTPGTSTGKHGPPLSRIQNHPNFPKATGEPPASQTQLDGRRLLNLVEREEQLPQITLTSHKGAIAYMHNKYNKKFKWKWQTW